MLLLVIYDNIFYKTHNQGVLGSSPSGTTKNYPEVLNFGVFCFYSVITENSPIET